MRKTISVATLLFALTCPSYAGDIQNDIYKPQANAVQEPSGGGITSDGADDGETSDNTGDILTQLTLEVLAVLPSLL